ncbi:DUF6919 domain-containing protein [Streptomyces sp. NPDC001404]|uniref:DUF6919 domain-containing protein n=1 Tax=Streptomyces sp. NPDC001404 TaxID=3364571 RepID=UPI0036A92028
MFRQLKAAAASAQSPKLPWMSRSDRRRWESARTLSDLGELMALWLEGSLGSRPGYAARFGPDEETAGLVPVLAACCRAGFVTEQSQPGEDDVAFDGRPWVQRAAVSGFVADKDLLQHVRAAAERAGLQVITETAQGRRKSVVVTQWAGRDHTSFGEPMPPSHLRYLFGAECHRQAVGALVAAWQVTVIDPVWGRNSVLWPTLSGALSARAGV